MAGIELLKLQANRSQSTRKYMAQLWAQILFRLR